MSLTKFQICLNHESPVIVTAGLNEFIKFVSADHSISHYVKSYTRSSTFDIKDFISPALSSIECKGLLLSYIKSSPKADELFTLWILPGIEDSEELLTAHLHVFALIINCTHTLQSYQHDIIRKIFNEFLDKLNRQLESKNDNIRYATLSLILAIVRTSYPISNDEYEQLFGDITNYQTILNTQSTSSSSSSKSDAYDNIFNNKNLIISIAFTLYMKVTDSLRYQLVLPQSLLPYIFKSVGTFDITQMMFVFQCFHYLHSEMYSHVNRNVEVLFLWEKEYIQNWLPLYSHTDGQLQTIIHDVFSSMCQLIITLFQYKKPSQISPNTISNEILEVDNTQHIHDTNKNLNNDGTSNFSYDNYMKESSLSLSSTIDIKSLYLKSKQLSHELLSCIQPHTNILHQHLQSMLLKAQPWLYPECISSLTLHSIKTTTNASASASASATTATTTRSWTKLSEPYQDYIMILNHMTRLNGTTNIDTNIILSMTKLLLNVSQHDSLMNILVDHTKVDSWTKLWYDVINSMLPPGLTKKELSKLLLHIYEPFPITTIQYLSSQLIRIKKILHLLHIKVETWSSIISKDLDDVNSTKDDKKSDISFMNNEDSMSTILFNTFKEVIPEYRTLIQVWNRYKNQLDKLLEQYTTASTITLNSIQYKEWNHMLDTVCHSIITLLSYMIDLVTMIPSYYHQIDILSIFDIIMKSYLTHSHIISTDVTIQTYIIKLLQHILILIYYVTRYGLCSWFGYQQDSMKLLSNILMNDNWTVYCKESSLYYILYLLSQKSRLSQHSTNTETKRSANSSSKNSSNRTINNHTENQTTSTSNVHENINLNVSVYDLSYNLLYIILSTSPLFYTEGTNNISSISNVLIVEEMNIWLHCITNLGHSKKESSNNDILLLNDTNTPLDIMDISQQLFVLDTLIKLSYHIHTELSIHSMNLYHNQSTIQSYMISLYHSLLHKSAIENNIVDDGGLWKNHMTSLPISPLLLNTLLLSSSSFTLYETYLPQTIRSKLISTTTTTTTTTTSVIDTNTSDTSSGDLVVDITYTFDKYAIHGFRRILVDMVTYPMILSLGYQHYAHSEYMTLLLEIMAINQSSTCHMTSYQQLYSDSKQLALILKYTQNDSSLKTYLSASDKKELQSILDIFHSSSLVDTETNFDLKSKDKSMTSLIPSPISKRTRSNSNLSVSMSTTTIHQPTATKISDIIPYYSSNLHHIFTGIKSSNSMLYSKLSLTMSLLPLTILSSSISDEYDVLFQRMIHIIDSVLMQLISNSSDSTINITILLSFLLSTHNDLSKLIQIVDSMKTNRQVSIESVSSQKPTKRRKTVTTQTIIKSTSLQYNVDTYIQQLSGILNTLEENIKQLILDQPNYILTDTFAHMIYSYIFCTVRNTDLTSRLTHFDQHPFSTHLLRMYLELCIPHKAAYETLLFSHIFHRNLLEQTTRLCSAYYTIHESKDTKKVNRTDNISNDDQLVPSSSSDSIISMNWFYIGWYLSQLKIQHNTNILQSLIKMIVNSPNSHILFLTSTYNTSNKDQISSIQSNQWNSNIEMNLINIYIDFVRKQQSENHINVKHTCTCRLHPILSAIHILLQYTPLEMLYEIYHYIMTHNLLPESIFCHSIMVQYDSMCTDTLISYIDYHSLLSYTHQMESQSVITTIKTTTMDTSTNRDRRYVPFCLPIRLQSLLQDIHHFYTHFTSIQSFITYMISSLQHIQYQSIQPLKMSCDDIIQYISEIESKHSVTINQLCNSIMQLSKNITPNECQLISYLLCSYQYVQNDNVINYLIYIVSRVYLQILSSHVNKRAYVDTVESNTSKKKKREEVSETILWQDVYLIVYGYICDDINIDLSTLNAMYSTDTNTNMTTLPSILNLEYILQIKYNHLLDVLHIYPTFMYGSRSEQTSKLLTTESTTKLGNIHETIRKKLNKVIKLSLKYGLKSNIILSQLTKLLVMLSHDNTKKDKYNDGNTEQYMMNELKLVYTLQPLKNDFYHSFTLFPLVLSHSKFQETFIIVHNDIKSNQQHTKMKSQFGKEIRHSQVDNILNKLNIVILELLLVLLSSVSIDDLQPLSNEHDEEEKTSYKGQIQAFKESADYLYTTVLPYYRGTLSINDRILLRIFTSLHRLKLIPPLYTIQLISPQSSSIFSHSTSSSTPTTVKSSIEKVPIPKKSKYDGVTTAWLFESIQQSIVYSTIKFSPLYRGILPPPLQNEHSQSHIQYMEENRLMYKQVLKTFQSAKNKQLRQIARRRDENDNDDELRVTDETDVETDMDNEMDMDMDVDNYNGHSNTEYLDSSIHTDKIDKLDIDQSTVYDMSFWLPVLLYQLQTVSDLHMRHFINSGLLSMLIACLHTKCLMIKSYSLTCISMVLDRLSKQTLSQDPLFRCRPQIIMLLTCLKHAIDYTHIIENSEDYNNQNTANSDDNILIQLPHITITFLSVSAMHLMQPQHELYGKINKYLLSRPYIDMKDIPLYDLLIMGSDTEMCINKRLSVLRIIRDHLWSHMDHLNLCRKNAYSRLMTLFPAAMNNDTRYLEVILDVFDTALCYPESSRYIIERCNLLLWLTQISQIHKYLVIDTHQTKDIPIQSSSTMLTSSLSSSLLTQESFKSNIKYTCTLQHIKILQRILSIIRRCISSIYLLLEGNLISTTILSQLYTLIHMKMHDVIWISTKYSYDVFSSTYVKTLIHVVWDYTFMSYLITKKQLSYNHTTNNNNNADDNTYRHTNNSPNWMVSQLQVLQDIVMKQSHIWKWSSTTLQHYSLLLYYIQYISSTIELMRKRNIESLNSSPSFFLDSIASMASLNSFSSTSNHNMNPSHLIKHCLFLSTMRDILLQYNKLSPYKYENTVDSLTRPQDVQIWAFEVSSFSRHRIKNDEEKTNMYPTPTAHNAMDYVTGNIFIPYELLYIQPVHNSKSTTNPDYIHVYPCDNMMHSDSDGADIHIHAHIHPHIYDTAWRHYAKYKYPNVDMETDMIHMMTVLSSLHMKIVIENHLSLLPALFQHIKSHHFASANNDIDTTITTIINNTSKECNIIGYDDVIDTMEITRWCLLQFHNYCNTNTNSNSQDSNSYDIMMNTSSYTKIVRGEVLKIMNSQPKSLTIESTDIYQHGELLSLLQLSKLSAFSMMISLATLVGQDDMIDDIIQLLVLYIESITGITLVADTNKMKDSFIIMSECIESILSQPEKWMIVDPTVITRIKYENIQEIMTFISYMVTILDRSASTALHDELVTSYDSDQSKDLKMIKILQLSVVLDTPSIKKKIEMLKNAFSIL